MARFDLPSDKLTIDDVRKRLKKNPNDPELLEYKRVLENFNKKLAPIHEEATLYAKRINASIGIFNKEYNAAIFGISAFKPPFQNVPLGQEFLKSQLKILEVINSITIPNATLLGLQRMTEDINRLTVPMRLLGQTVAMLQTPNLFNKLTGMKTNWIVPGYMPSRAFNTQREYNTQIVKEKEILTGKLEQLEEIEPEVTDRPYYYYEETKTFLIKVTNLAAIVFYTKRGNPNVEILFKSFYELLEERGKIIGEFKKVFVSKKELTDKLISKGVKEPNGDWIKHTKSSIMNHKVPSFLEDSFSISEYDRTAGGYHFQIRVKRYMPKLH